MENKFTLLRRKRRGCGGQAVESLKLKVSEEEKERINTESTEEEHRGHGDHEARCDG
jgi:hypothetical protein